MDAIRFIFWETLKVLSLAFLGVLGAKAVGGLRLPAKPEEAAFPSDLARRVNARPQISRLSGTKLALYAVALALVALGARSIGNDLAAEIYFRAGRGSLVHFQPEKAYTNTLRAVQLRSGELKYWQMLSAAKFSLRQYQSLLDDQPALEALEGEDLDQGDAMRFAYAHFLLARYDQTIALTTQLIRRNRSFAPPYVLLGMTYMAEKKYKDAERTFLEVLQMHPTQEEAVEGLAHAYFLMGSQERALAVLHETARFPFSLEARKRFEELKALYRLGSSSSAGKQLNAQ
jgi:tetratricopeptide (TPR) repeat protein